MLNHINVIKRNGRKEPLDMEKIHKVLTWAAEGLDDVSVSEVELQSKIQLIDGVKTSDIHELLIKSAADLISERSPGYQYMSARLAIFHLRKRAYGQYEPPTLKHHIENLVSKGFYDPEILEKYSDDDLTVLNCLIDHDRDLKFSYSGVKQLEGKYLVQNRVTKEIYETPQMAYMLIGMCLFSEYTSYEEKGKTRLDYVKKFYDAVSLFKLSLPTPIMGGVRTLTRQFSSCVLIECGDTLDSINATATSVVTYISKRAGIGLNVGRIRAIGSEIRGGDAEHTGVIPFIKHFQTAVKSCSQGGIRGGAATLFYPLWHLEVESLLVLKNNRGVEENRARHLDYGIQLNKMLYTRMMKGENITMFSPSDVPGLYDAFFEDQDEFERLYLKYEADESIRKKTVKALDLFSELAKERSQTGRIYIHNVDHTNTHSAFNSKKAPTRQSNLCLEITLPTKPVSLENPSEGEIALCTLSAFNLGALESLEEIEGLADIAVRSLDGLLSYQDYSLEAARVGGQDRRSLGIGITNLAYYLAKNGVKYSDDSSLPLVHRTFEAIQYYCLKASNNLARDFGSCKLYRDTNYYKGVLPIDTYKKEVDEVCSEPLHLDWEGLRQDIKTYGLRNSTVTALMPCETSSQVTNSTNGIEPPRGYVSIKSSKDGILKQVVPEFKRLRQNYELLWQIPNNKGYINIVGVMQKFVDQAISANTNYDPEKFPESKVPIKVVLQDLLYSYKLGLKTLYYHNTKDGSTDASAEEDDGCAGGACKL